MASDGCLKKKRTQKKMVGNREIKKFNDFEFKSEISLRENEVFD